jgi:hypothetical protein
MNKIKDLVYRIRWWVIVMDLLILSSPFLSPIIIGPENSIYFLGVCVMWVFLNIYKGQVNKSRYLLQE